MKTKSLLAAIALATTALTGAARADLTLTPAGTALNFTLTQFYKDPTVLYGILGVTSGPGGDIYAAGYARGQVYKFADVDGQTFGSALATNATPGTPTGIAYVGGKVYLGILGGGYYSVDPTTLALTPLALDAGVDHAYGMWANPVTGHILAGDFTGLIDINPLTGHVTQVGPSVPDGVTISPDGKTAYGEYNNNEILGYSLTAPNPSVPVFNSGFIGGGPDGTGIITGGSLNGDIIVNLNDGAVVLLNPTTLAQTIIASGGTRGDNVGPDLTNGTLFLDSYDINYRLGLKGGTIGSTAPEPATLALMGAGFAGLSALRRRRNKRHAA